MHSVICLNSPTFRDVLWVPSSTFKKNAWYKWFGWINTSRPGKRLVVRRHLIGGHALWYVLYLLTAIGLTPGGSSTVHIYSQTIHRTTQLTTSVGRLSGIRTQSGQNKINDSNILDYRHTQHTVKFVLCVTNLETTYFYPTPRLDLCIRPNNLHKALFLNTYNGTDKTSRNVGEFRQMTLRSSPEARILIRNEAKASHFILCNTLF